MNKRAKRVVGMGRLEVAVTDLSPLRQFMAWHCVLLPANNIHRSPAHRTDDSVRHASVLREASTRHMVPTSSGISNSVLKPRHPLYLAALNVRTLKQAGQQAALALTLDSLGYDGTCCEEDSGKCLSRHPYLPTILLQDFVKSFPDSIGANISLALPITTFGA
ncbi:hypothetical protein T265_11185 [Opisthorchis viverrini]|uniref:Uncharacterized protein n=1 Tax=Opisthorchis viverrini TaxID=6198 RepID=A0A074ZAH5_OPIVI|nr:hypothetical protein T265_11185 [Opisthorchis viverrini]KER20215.1 hypothetical protein T265_11185 [Opisthorchis viverrini]